MGSHGFAAVACLGAHPGRLPETRLAAAAGFPGAPASFSASSAGAVNLLGRAAHARALAEGDAHLPGSLSPAALGMLTVKRFLTGG